MISSNDLVSFLKKSSSADFSFMQNLKIVYRPYICPFNDLLNKLPEHQSVFDFGCGGGMFLQLVAEFRKPIALGGIEISPELIDTAKALLKKYPEIPVDLTSYNGDNIPLRIGNYDFVFMIDVLHHIPKNKQISHLTDLFTLMKPGARLILKDIDLGSPFVLFNKIHDMLVVHEIGNEMNPLKLQPLLQKIGFGVSEVKYKRMIVYPHYTFDCQKMR